MRLRHRLLLLFGVFALVPLLAMGFFDYARSLRHLEAVLSVQTANIARRAAQELRDRLDLQESDLVLLSENTETQRLLRLVQGGTTGKELDAAIVAAEQYWGELWRSMQWGYSRLAITDQAGKTLVALGTVADPRNERMASAPSRTRPVRDIDTKALLGKLEFIALASDLARSPVFRTVFGVDGRTFIVDRAERRILIEPSNNSQGIRDLPFDPQQLDREQGTFSYVDETGRGVASFVSLAHPAWSLIVTASLDEFARPFVQLRLLDLAVLLAVVVAVSVAFFLLLGRATASLDGLTMAADRVGRGDLNPDLPPVGTDEVGRLSAAFGLMTARIREMIAQVETSRQMGVLGRFAAELSHEIRNPLTAIKINLQGLARDARDGRIPDDSRRAVDMALREIRRLDLAVKTALRTGKPPAEPRPFHLHDVLTECVELVRPQAGERSVTVQAMLNAIDDELAGDADAIRGAVLNLLLNAIEAMPSGGNLWVTTTTLDRDGEPSIEVRIRDDGPGIPYELRDRVFRPFFTTKSEGTGLGLSVALQTVRAHAGTLTLGDAEQGTELAITLPVRTATVIR
jgi:signal transduction histidine kinase